MGRFELYGDKLCEQCIYYRRSEKCGGIYRCDHEHNLGKNWLGTLYFKNPESINLHNKCQYWEKKNA